MKSKSAAIALIIWLTSVVLLWGLAFVPVSEQAPDWILAAKYICFGKTESGLPEAYGWLNLAGSPMIMLIAIFIIWTPSVIINTVQIYLKNRIYLAIVSFYILIFLWLFLNISSRINVANQAENIIYAFNNNSLPENFPVTNKHLPDFLLMNETGKSVRQDYIKGPALLTFAYLHCETICPLLIENSIKASKLYSEKESVKNVSGADNISRDISIYVVTLDPWRDKPGQLAQMIQKWNLPPNAHVLTSSDPDKVIKILNKLEVERTRNEQTGDITHAGLIYVLNKKSKIKYTLINPGVMRIVDALEKVR